MCGFVALWFLYSAMHFIYLFWAAVTLHINALSIWYNESVHRKEQHTSGINMIP